MRISFLVIARVCPCRERGFRLPTAAIVGKPSRAAYFREYNRKRRADPDYRDKNRQWSAAWRATHPDYAARKYGERRADPDKVADDRQRNRDMMKAKRADPAYRARENARARARYQARKMSEGH